MVGKHDHSQQSGHLQGHHHRERYNVAGYFCKYNLQNTNVLSFGCLIVDYRCMMISLVRLLFHLWPQSLWSFHRVKEKKKREKQWSTNLIQKELDTITGIKESSGRILAEREELPRRMSDGIQLQSTEWIAPKRPVCPATSQSNQSHTSIHQP